MQQLTFLDLCSGIGGFRLGLESAGHRCIGYCEYDRFARASYEAMYDTEGEWKADDVTKLKSEDVPYGFLVDADGVDYFVHYSEIQSEGFKTLKNNMEVSFVAEEDEKGRSLAKCVVPILAETPKEE